MTNDAPPATPAASMNSNRLNMRGSTWTTLEARCVIRTAGSLVMRVQRVRTQRAASTRERAAGCGKAVRRNAILDPADDRARASKLSSAGPPEQCPMPGDRNKRLQFLTCSGPPLAFVIRS